MDNLFGPWTMLLAGALGLLWPFLMRQCLQKFQKNPPASFHTVLERFEDRAPLHVTLLVVGCAWLILDLI